MDSLSRVSTDYLNSFICCANLQDVTLKLDHCANFSVSTDICDMSIRNDRNAISSGLFISTLPNIFIKNG